MITRDQSRLTLLDSGYYYCRLDRRFEQDLPKTYASDAPLFSHQRQQVDIDQKSEGHSRNLENI